LIAAHKNGLVDEEGQPVARYYALITAEHEPLIRELTGYQKKAAGLCACGCGRNPRGRGQHATEACRLKAFRQKRKVTDNAEVKRITEKTDVEATT
jgi:hypothetical protein